MKKITQFIIWYLKLRKMGYSHGVSVWALKGEGGIFYKKNEKT